MLFKCWILDWILIEEKLENYFENMIWELFERMFRIIWEKCFENYLIKVEYWESIIEIICLRNVNSDSNVRYF